MQTVYLARVLAEYHGLDFRGIVLLHPADQHFKIAVEARLWLLMKAQHMVGFDRFRSINHQRKTPLPFAELTGQQVTRLGMKGFFLPGRARMKLL